MQLVRNIHWTNEFLTPVPDSSTALPRGTGEVGNRRLWPVHSTSSVAPSFSHFSSVPTAKEHKFFLWAAVTQDKSALVWALHGLQFLQAIPHYARMRFSRSCNVDNCSAMVSPWSLPISQTAGESLLRCIEHLLLLLLSSWSSCDCFSLSFSPPSPLPS